MVHCFCKDLIYKFLKCTFYCTNGAVRGKVGPGNRLKHARLVAVVTPPDPVLSKFVIVVYSNFFWWRPVLLLIAAVILGAFAIGLSQICSLFSHIFYMYSEYK